MLPDSGAMTVINTRHRCRICFAILKAPIHGKTSTYYSVHSNRRLGGGELSLLPFLDEECNQLLQQKCTSLSNDRSKSCSSMSFMDLMERFLRVSVDNSGCIGSGDTEAVAVENGPVKTVAAASHSDIICLKCSSILTKISELHLALQKLATSLREKYLKTLRIVGNVDIQQQRKSNGFCCPSGATINETPVLPCKDEPNLDDRAIGDDQPESNLCKSAIFCKKYGLTYKPTADGNYPCECQKSKKKAARLREGGVQTSGLSCDSPHSAVNDNLKVMSQQKNCAQWNRFSKRKGKPRHHIKIGDRRVAPSDANRFRPSCSGMGAGTSEFRQSDRIAGRLCSTGADETTADIASPDFANIDAFNSFKQCQAPEIDKVTAVIDKDSRLAADHTFTNEHNSEKACPSKTASLADINLQHYPGGDEMVDRSPYANECRSDSGHQEEDEENGIRSILCSTECVKTHSKCCTGQTCTASSREYLPVNDDRRAKANNINRIAATLMGDCNSTDSMEVEEGYSPTNLPAYEQHGIADTCNSNLDDFFTDSCPPPSGVVKKEAQIFSPCRSAAAGDAAVNFKGEQQHFVGNSKHHKRLRNDYSDTSPSVVNGPSKLANRSQHNRDDIPVALKYRHGQDNNPHYFANLKLSSNAAFVHDGGGGAEDVNSSRFSAFSPVPIDSLCKSSGLNGAKVPGTYSGFEGHTGTSKGFDSSSVQGNTEQSASVSALLRGSPVKQLSGASDLRNPSATLATGCLVNKGGVAAVSSKVSNPAHPQLHSRQLGNFKRYQCGFCGKIVTNIQIHVRRHTNEKPYRCEYCEKRFTNSGDLQIHTRIHTGEKPYRCPICAKSYRTIGNFNSHVKTHDRGERPHRCVLCNETFEQTRDWFSHLRSNHKVSPTSPTTTTPTTTATKMA